jgi:chemotaxis protein MotA
VFLVTIIAGILIVFGSVLFGYLLERGQLLVLLQPAELVIICGAAAGSLFVAHPWKNLRNLAHALRALKDPPRYSPEYYVQVLKLLYTLMSLGQRAGVRALEEHVDVPEKSRIFQDYPVLSSEPPALMFLCDSLRIVTSTGLQATEAERLFALDLEVQRAGKQQPVNMLMNLADSLPGLGIVAAVLGVVITMQALGGPAAEIGQSVAAALVGTFLGILLCYGLVAPLATHMQSLNRARMELLNVIRMSLLANVRGCSPVVAAEFGRRAIPAEMRPTFEALERELRHHTPLNFRQAGLENAAD